MVAKKKGAILAIAFLVSLGVVSALHTVTTSSGGAVFHFEEDVSGMYELVVNNTDVGAGASITDMAVSLPEGFTFIPFSDGTTASPSNFSSVSGELVWTHAGGLVLSGASHSFFFNASAETPGTFPLLIVTTNASGTQVSSLTIVINDTTPVAVTPSSFVSPTNGASISGTAVLSLSITDSSPITLVYFNISTPEGVQSAVVNAVNSSPTAWGANLDTSALSDGNYLIRVFARDGAGNSNDSAFISVVVDNTDPSVSLSEESSTRTSITVSTSCTDNSGSCSCTLTSSSGDVSGSEISDLECEESYTITYTCVDSAGNSDSEDKTMTTDDCNQQSGGGGSSRSSWTDTFIESDKEMREKQTFSGKLKERQRVRILHEGKLYFVGLTDVTRTEATLEFSSSSREAELEINESTEVDLDADGYFDLSVQLVSITGASAEVVLTYIHTQTVPTEQDFVPLSASAVSSEDTLVFEGSEAPGEETAVSSGVRWGVIGFAIIGIVLIFGMIVAYRLKRKSSNIPPHMR